jgi:mono/diheme cytochrome c family protein
MKRARWGLWLGVAAPSCVALAFSACSSSSSNTKPESMDATAQEASPPEDAPSEPIEEASVRIVDAGTTSDVDADAATVDASDSAVPDGSADASVEAAAAACVPVDAGKPDDAAVAAGLAVINSFAPHCFICHGDDFSGGQLVSMAYPKNLTPDPATGLGCWTDEQIVTAMLYGTTPDGTTLCVMPQWSTKGMTPDQAEDVVHYLRALPPVSNAVPASFCEIKADAGASGDGGDAGDAGDGGDGG